MTAAILALALGRLLAQPVPQSTVDVGATLVCVTLTAAETHARGRHLFLCGNLVTGELLGGLLRRSGREDCRISGAVDPASLCYVVSGCGTAGQGCL